MSNLKKKVAAVGAALVFSIVATATSASSASAASPTFQGGDMDQACRLATYPASEGVQHSNLWTAYLMYPSQGVYGWRCYYNNAPWAYAYSNKYPLYVQVLCYSSISLCF